MFLLVVIGVSDCHKYNFHIIWTVSDSRWCFSTNASKLGWWHSFSSGGALWSQNRKLFLSVLRKMDSNITPRKRFLLKNETLTVLKWRKYYTAQKCQRRKKWISVGLVCCNVTTNNFQVVLSANPTSVFESIVVSPKHVWCCM